MVPFTVFSRDLDLSLEMRLLSLDLDFNPEDHCFETETSLSLSEASSVGVPSVFLCTLEDGGGDCGDSMVYVSISWVSRDWIQFSSLLGILIFPGYVVMSNEHEGWVQEAVS